VPVSRSKLHQPAQTPILPNPGLLAATGPIVPVQIDLPEALAKLLADSSTAGPSPISGWAVIDAGASTSVVDATLVNALGVKPVGVAKVGTARGPARQPVYPIRITIQGIILTMSFSRVTGAPLKEMGSMALLGRDMLTRMILFNDGPRSEYTLAY
jgi:hypothetical protein